MSAVITKDSLATRKILYAEEPCLPGERFVEIRQWETMDEAHIEMIVEYGRLDEAGELTTICKVVPLFMTVDEILETLA